MKMSAAQQCRCPEMPPEIWEQIASGPERAEWDLTLSDKRVLRVPFFDGMCGDYRAVEFFPLIVSVAVVPTAPYTPPPLKWVK